MTDVLDTYIEKRKKYNDEQEATKKLSIVASHNALLQEIIKVIEANLNTLHEQMNNLELEVINLRKDLNEIRSYVIDDGK